MKRLILLILLFTVNSIFGQGKFNSSQIKHWNLFKAENSQMEIIWDNNSGSIQTIKGHYNNKTKGSVSDIISSFLKKVCKIVEISGNNKIIFQKSEILNGKHYYYYKQVFYDNRVFNCGFLIIYNPSTKYIMMNGTFHPNIVIGNSKYQKEDVYQLLEAKKDFTKIKTLSEPIEYIYPNKGKYFLAFNIDILDNKIGKSVFIDSETGEIIEEFLSNTSYSGRVFPIDPGEGADVLTLNGLPAGSTGLNGTLVKVTNVGFENALISNGNFIFDITSPHIAEVNAYYHGDKILRELFNSSNGFSGFGYPIELKVNDSFEFVASGINKQPYTITFGIEESRVKESSKKDDVIYHEITHQVAKKLGMLYVYDVQSAAHEAYADYFAAAFTDDPIMGEWLTKSTQGNTRIVNGFYTIDDWGDEFYPNNYLSDNQPVNWPNGPHLRSMIYSNILWEIRDRLSEPVANKIFIESMKLYNSSDISDPYGHHLFMRKITLANEIIYSNNSNTRLSNQFHIEDAFRIRGITDGPIIRPFEVVISGPTSLNSGQSGQFNIQSMTSPNHPVTYTWFKRYPSGTTPFVADDVWVQLTGSVTSISLSETKNFDVKCEVRDSRGVIVVSNIIHVSIDGAVPTVNKQDEELLSENEQIKETELFQNYPNPFNPNTKIEYQIKADTNVKLEIFNSLGENVKTLVNENQSKGNYQVSFDASSLPSGIYFSVLKTPEKRIVKKMLLVK